jgi:hypothetical protein
MSVYRNTHAHRHSCTRTHTHTRAHACGSSVMFFNSLMVMESNSWLSLNYQTQARLSWTADVTQLNWTQHNTAHNNYCCYTHKSKLFCDWWSVGHPMTRFFLLLDICSLPCCGMPTLMRGWVCNLLIQFAVALRSKSRRTHDHILLSHLRPQGSLFVASYDSQGYGGGILTCLHMGQLP